MIQTIDFTKAAAQQETFDFFTPDEKTLLTQLTCRASALLSDAVLQLLHNHLADLDGQEAPAAPVALWFKHLERGDAPRNSTSRLHAILFLEGGELVARPLGDLPAAVRAGTLEILATFFLTEDLCEGLYYRAGFSIFKALDAVHFRNFTLLRGDPASCGEDSFEELLEELEFGCNTQGLKLAMHPWAATERGVIFSKEVEQALNLIHRVAG